MTLIVLLVERPTPWILPVELGDNLIVLLLSTQHFLLVKGISIWGIHIVYVFYNLHLIPAT
jgi:hypothetical protein